MHFTWRQEILHNGPAESIFDRSRSSFVRTINWYKIQCLWKIHQEKREHEYIVLRWRR
jgi:hypothetical protein